MWKWFKKKDKHKKWISVEKPIKFIGSYNSVTIIYPKKYGGLGVADNDDYCFLITLPIFPPCDMTIDLDRFCLILVGIYHNYLFEYEDEYKYERIWRDIPILQLIKLENEDKIDDLDSEYSYNLLKKEFDDIEITKQDKL